MTDPSPTRHGLAFTLLEDELAICRLDSGARIPPWARKSSFWSLSGSSEELSVVCGAENVPQKVKHARGWRGLKIEGPLDLQIVGVLEAIARPLTRAGVSIFAVSTFDTDYILVREKHLEKAIAVLEHEGHRRLGPDGKPIEPSTSSDSGEDEDKAPRRSRRRRRRRGVAASAESDGEAGPDSAIADERPEPAAPEAEGDEGDDERPKRRRRRRRRKDDPDRAVSESGTAESASDDHGRAGSEADEREAPESESESEPESEAAEPAEAPEAVDSDRSESGERPAGRPRRSRSERGGRSRSRDDDDGPEDVTSDGLYTGAIAQAPLAITEGSFADLGLSAPILETIEEIGFTHPTPIQLDAIPAALSGRDVIGLAQTGSGKTAAFSLPLAEKLTHGKGVRGLILCPTREIALQTKAFLEIFGHDHALETAVVIGGVRMGPQIQHLARHPDIIVATPGRLADHVRRGNVSLRKVERLVLDEADHMLDLGFLPQIQEILETLPQKRQTMMFSATMPPPIARLAGYFMSDPLTIDFRPEGRTAEGIEHRLYLVRDEDRSACLFSILREIPGTTLIFLRRKIRTEWMTRLLEEAGFTAERIHSDRSQAQRVHALRGFRTGDHRILVATDVAARGIDVPAIRHVVNFGVPDQVEDYVHRAGRTARGSNDGIVSTIASPLEKGTIKEIEMEIGQKLERHTAEGVEPWKEIKRKKRIRRRLL